jgi:hypothetical protein
VLNAGVFDDFKGAATLLLWGDEEGMAALFSGLSDLREGQRNELAIDGADTQVTVRSASDRTQWSTLRNEEGGVCWECSQDMIELATDLIEPLLRRAGHQFLDVTGLAEQVIIARDVYPPDLR